MSIPGGSSVFDHREEVHRLSPVLVARLGCGRRRMVLGVLGVQPQAVACVDGQLKAGSVSARLKAGKMHLAAAIVSES